jgi:hypothetical protein
MSKPYNNIEEYKVYMEELNNKQADLFNKAISRITKDQFDAINKEEYPDPIFRIQELFIAAEMDFKEFFVLE